MCIYMCVCVAHGFGCVYIYIHMCTSRVVYMNMCINIYMGEEYEVGCRATFCITETTHNVEEGGDEMA